MTKIAQAEANDKCGQFKLAKQILASKSKTVDKIKI